MPGPTRYRNLVRDTALALRGQAAALDTQALVLEQIMQEDVADRLILSWENFLSFGLRLCGLDFGRRALSRSRQLDPRILAGVSAG